MSKSLERIAEVEEGAVARVRGRVRRIVEPLRSPLLDHRCVFWEVRDGPDEKTREQGVQPFWLEDESGRVLVNADAIAAAVWGERAVELVGLPEEQALEARLEAIRGEMPEDPGSASVGLVEERFEIATLMMLRKAVLGRARGEARVGSSLAEQDAFIRDNAGALLEGAERESVDEAIIERWEGVVAEGDEVEIVGTFRREIVPAALRAMSGMEEALGYREGTRALAVSGSRAAPLRLRGLGRKAPPRQSKKRGAARRGQRGEAAIDWRVALVGAVGVALCLWYWLG